MIIGFCGLPRVGKDTAADHMVAKHGFTKFHPADAVKDVALLIDPLVDGTTRLSALVDDAGWTAAKEHPECRRLLQRIGTEAGRDFHGANVWVDRTMAAIDALPEDAPAVISGVRFPNEMWAINRRGGVLVRVLRDVQLSIETASHASETEAAALIEDHLLHNHTDIGDLKKRVDRLLVRIQSLRRNR
jgi:hypothetical protein